MKRIVAGVVGLMFLLLMIVGSAVAKKGDAQRLKLTVADEIQLQNDVKNFFVDLYDTMEENSTKTYKQSDFDGIEGYIVGCEMVNTRESYIKLNGGIHRASVGKVEIKDYNKRYDGIHLKVYVPFEYEYGENEVCGGGEFYRILVVHTNDKFIVRNLMGESFELQEAKDYVEQQSGTKDINSVKNRYGIVDEYYEQLKKMQMKCKQSKKTMKRIIRLKVAVNKR